jgi:hypothetical protein
MISLRRRSRKDLRVVDRRDMDLMERMWLLQQREKNKKKGSFGKDLSKVKFFVYNKYGHLASQFP